MVQLHLLCTIFCHILKYAFVFSNRTKAVLTRRRPRNAQQHRAASPTSMNDQSPGGAGVHRWGCCCFMLPHAFSGEKMATKYSSHLQGQGNANANWLWRTKGSKSKGTVYIYIYYIILAFGFACFLYFLARARQVYVSIFDLIPWKINLWPYPEAH